MSSVPQSGDPVLPATTTAASGESAPGDPAPTPVIGEATSTEGQATGSDPTQNSSTDGLTSLDGGSSSSTSSATNLDVSTVFDLNKLNQLNQVTNDAFNSIATKRQAATEAQEEVAQAQVDLAKAEAAAHNAKADADTAQTDAQEALQAERDYVVQALSALGANTAGVNTSVAHS